MNNIYRIWVVLLMISGLIALWFSGKALTEMWVYSRLDSATAAKTIRWDVREMGSSRFQIEATFYYEVKGLELENTTLFASHQYLNRYAAEQEIKGSADKAWNVWYQKNNPSFSSLEKEFPVKKSLHALLTIGVFVYFFFARGLMLRCAL
jgi:hypothetical protein